MGDPKKKVAIGIDLGTTYCCVAVYRKNGKVEIIPNDVGNRITPSYVAFKGGDLLVGEGARFQASRNPENTIYDAKRLIGRRFNDKVVQDDIKLWPFKVVPDNEDKPLIQVVVADGKVKKFAPEEISAILLKKLKATADDYLQTTVTDAVITVPAYFTDAQRQATIDAGKLAGLEVLRIINEPTAAAIAYGLKKKEFGDRLVLVFDFGGGTLDVTILNINGDVYKARSTTGHMHLGGEDLDNRIVEYFVQQIKRRLGVDISNDKKAIRRVKTECENTKKELTYQIQAHIEIECLLGSDEPPFYSVLARARFEDLCADQFAQAMRIVEKALSDAKVDKSEIDDIVLSGGSSRIPKIKSMLETFFNGKSLCQAINADEAVATGAAIQAALLIGADDAGIADIVMQDVTPMTLGIQVIGGKMSEVIERAASLPAVRKRIYTTTEDNQSVVSIFVYEGDNELAVDNTLLAGFELQGIRLAKAGVPQITVTFKKDINGVLHVTAADESVKVSNSVTINRRNTPVSK